MKKFTANYSRSNSNFIITNLPNNKIISTYTNIIRIVQNMIMRGNPTIASKFLRDELNLERDYLDNMKEIKFLSKENLSWTKTIKGDVSNDDYPAEQFYDDLEDIFNRVGFIRNLTIAEYPIANILPDVQHAFNKQMVDFYIPLLKTVIEVDGEDHQNQKSLDQKRDKALERSGINVVRIETKSIRNRDYEQFKTEFRKIYLDNKDKIEDYREYLDSNPKDYEVDIKLASIVRFQVFILELLDRGVLSFDSRNWKFNVFAANARDYLELALKDLELWIGNVAALFNTTVEMPSINIIVYENQGELENKKDHINVKFDLHKRWDDTIWEDNVYHIRTDFDDDANYFVTNINEPVIYALRPEKHQRYLEYLLENLFGHKTFNEGQLDIIINSLNGEDTVGLLPTGGGKSLTYQLCVMLQPAISFVVVPIKSLMLDQINNLTGKNHITHASYINGDLSPSESSKRLKDFASGKFFFLIISPERFQARSFRDEISLVNRTKALSIAVIDEVHCLSEWGHEFRTSYLALAKSIRKFAPSSRFLALTATASSKVLKDITAELQIESNNIRTISNFTRKELEFNIIKVNKSNRLEHLMQLSRDNMGKNESRDQGKGPSLIFTSNVDGKNGCFEISQNIHLETGYRTAFYSGKPPKSFDRSLFSSYKDETQDAFMRDQIDVLVATKAFGMGIDKGNIRQTIHYGIPGSLESFYQEAGRAGRDRNKSNCIVLYSPDHLNDEQTQFLFGMNTDLTVLNKEKKKLKGDLNSLMFFLTSNLMDIEEEVKEIFDFYYANFTNEDTEVVLDFKNNKDQSRKEKSIYRLAVLGIVDDWTMNWKSREIEVELAEWNEQTVTDNLTNHIKKYDYMFTLDRNDNNSAQYDVFITQFQDNETPFLKRILFVLLKWYNDNVIYSRKRSMLLMKQYADEFTDSQSLQEKVETYFKRNNDVYLLEKIVAKEDKFKNWYKIFYVQEEGKDDQPRALSTFKSLKITVSRFLESYNNDISLNLINGMISLAEDDFNSIDGRDRMASSVRQVSNLDGDDRQEMLTSILHTSDIFLTFDQRSQLSEMLISNGFEFMEDLKQIHLSLEDKLSYGNMIKTLHSTIREKSEEGYPWEV